MVPFQMRVKLVEQALSPVNRELCPSLLELICRKTGARSPTQFWFGSLSPPSLRDQTRIRRKGAGESRQIGIRSGVRLADAGFDAVATACLGSIQCQVGFPHKIVAAATIGPTAP
jgi:hypothetical protein